MDVLTKLVNIIMADPAAISALLIRDNAPSPSLLLRREFENREQITTETGFRIANSLVFTPRPIGRIRRLLQKASSKSFLICFVKFVKVVVSSRLKSLIRSFRARVRLCGDRNGAK